MYTPEEVLAYFNGVGTRAAILQHSSARRIAASVRSGTIVRMRRGVYGLPELPKASALAIKTAGVVSHISAAEHWEFGLVRRPAATHVTIPENSNAKPIKGVRFHRRPLGHHETDDRGGGLRVTSPMRTVIDAAATLPFNEALAIADSALRQGAITSYDLNAEEASFSGQGRAHVSRIARHATGLAANPLESSLRAICIENRLGRFVPQLWVRDWSLSYRLDLGDENRMIDLEADGYAHHGHRKDLHYDHTRNCELIRRGWLVLRFSWEHVMLDPNWVAGIIRDTLRHRRVRPGRGKS